MWVLMLLRDGGGNMFVVVAVVEAVGERDVAVMHRLRPFAQAAPCRSHATLWGRVLFGDQMH